MWEEEKTTALHNIHTPLGLSRTAQLGEGWMKENMGPPATWGGLPMSRPPVAFEHSGLAFFAHGSHSQPAGPWLKAASLQLGRAHGSQPAPCSWGGGAEGLECPHPPPVSVAAAAGALGLAGCSVGECLRSTGGKSRLRRVLTLLQMLSSDSPRWRAAAASSSDCSSCSLAPAAWSWPSWVPSLQRVVDGARGRGTVVGRCMYRDWQQQALWICVGKAAGVPAGKLLSIGDGSVCGLHQPSGSGL